MSPEACVAYLDQTFEFCWNALVSLKSNPKTIVFCVELDLQDLLLKVIVLYIALVPLFPVYSNTMHWCRSNQTLKLSCSKFARFASQTFIVLYIALVPLSPVYSNTMYFHWSSFSAFNFALHGVNGHPSSVYIAVCTVPSSKIHHIAFLDLVCFIH